MRRTVSLIMAIFLVLSLTACSGKPSASTSSPAPSAPDVPSQQSQSTVDAESLPKEQPDTAASSEAEDTIVNTATLEDFEKHPGDAERMKPITEDYFYYQTTHTLDDVVLIQQIHSYDEQGDCCGDAIKRVYSSEAAAKSEYDKPMYDAIRSNIALVGVVFYQTTEGGCGNRKLDDLEQYLWWQKYGGDTEKEFFSIPIQ